MVFVVDLASRVHSENNLAIESFLDWERARFKNEKKTNCLQGLHNHNKTTNEIQPTYS